MPSYREAQPPGFEITQELRTWETQRKCPRCVFEMYAGEKEDFRLEACGRCGGVFLTDEQAKRALVTGSRAPEQLAKKVEGVTHPVARSERALPCPECGKDMVPTPLGATVVDVCAGHGTWFDRTELHIGMRAMRGEPDTEGKAAEERYLEALKAPFSSEIQEIKRTLHFVIDALLSKRK